MKVPEGFVDAKTIKTKRRLIVSVEGPQKTGKTHQLLTAPDPIAFFDMDIGTEGVVTKFPDKQVWVAQYDYHTLKGPDISSIIAMWERMKANFLAMLVHPEVKTIGVDTGTEMWELIRMARLGKLTQVMPHHYGPVNAEFRDLIRQSYASGKNVILIHKVKAEYVNDKRTGKLERAGFSDIGFLVQVNLRAWREDGNFGFTIIDCRHNPKLNGMEFSGDMANFDFLSEIVLG